MERISPIPVISADRPPGSALGRRRGARRWRSGCGWRRRRGGRGRRGSRRGCGCRSARRRACDRAGAWARRREDGARNVQERERKDQHEDHDHDHDPDPRDAVLAGRQRASIAGRRQIAATFRRRAALVGHPSPITNATRPAAGRRVATSTGRRAWRARAVPPVRRPRSARRRASAPRRLPARRQGSRPLPSRSPSPQR